MTYTYVMHSRHVKQEETLETTTKRCFLQHQGKTQKPRYWATWREGTRVIIEYGIEGGKLQTTMQSFPEGVNVGKKNEKGPDVVAQEWMDRQIKRRKREGYKEQGDESTGGVDHFDFDNPGSNIRFLKPQNNLSTYLRKKMAKKEAIYTRKRNGNFIAPVIGSSGDPNLYTLTMAHSHKDEDIPWIQRFPGICQDLLDFNIPNRSALLCELVNDPVVDHKLRVDSIMKSLTPRALELQEEGGPLYLVIWDIAFWGGEQLIGHVPVVDRLNLMQQLRSEFIAPVDILEEGTEIEADDGSVMIFDGSEEMAIEIAKMAGWEGYVMIDPDATYEADKVISYHGKPARPKECGKLKPTYEADFIARWDPDNGIGEWGKGKKSVGIGAVNLYLLDENGEEVFISKCGGGLSIVDKVDKKTGELIKEADITRMAHPEMYPMVWRVEFSGLTDHGSLNFPQFCEERDDKPYEECTLDQLDGIPQEGGGEDDEG
jgi:predicted DNA-binding WGR domain protein